GSIKGMLDTLDPHTSYLKPDQYREMKVETTGEFGGIGIEVEPRPSADGSHENVLTIMGALEGTPAFKAGLQTGDTILKIDDAPTRSMNMDEAVRRMRGKKGSTVNVTIGRRGWKDPKVFTLQREIIRIDNVATRSIEPGFGYVRLKQFSEN